MVGHLGMPFFALLHPLWSRGGNARQRLKEREREFLLRCAILQSSIPFNPVCTTQPKHPLAGFEDIFKIPLHWQLDFWTLFMSTRCPKSRPPPLRKENFICDWPTPTCRGAIYHCQGSKCSSHVYRQFGLIYFSKMANLFQVSRTSFHCWSLPQT